MAANMAPGTRGQQSNSSTGSTDAEEAPTSQSAIPASQKADLSNMIRDVVKEHITALKDALIPKDRGTKRKHDAVSSSDDDENGGADHHADQLGHADRGQNGSDDDELEAYYKTLGDVLEEGEKTSEDLPPKVIGVFKKTIGHPFEKQICKGKEGPVPRPGNAPTLKPPQLNNALKHATTQNGRTMDRRMVEMLLNLTAAMTAMARQAAT